MIKHGTLFILLCIAVSAAGCARHSANDNSRYAETATPDTVTSITVSGIRDFPYPYSAMLALCSDIDGTTPREFEDYHRFLNTKEQTAMGEGLGLDIADSFWMFMSSDIDHIADRDGNGNEAVMTWFHGTSDDVKDAELIADYFNRGWIDSIHSWGDFSRKDENEYLFTRDMAVRAAAALRERHIFPSVWINHGNAANAQNLEADDLQTYRRGADPDSDMYHADITIPLGIRFVWFSDYDENFGRRDVLYPATLADGQTLWGFRRYTPDWSVYGIGSQLTEENLNALVENGLPVVVAQHFGGTAYYQPFLAEACGALRRLSGYHNRGEILVARTSRLLEYLRVRDHIVFGTSGTTIDITAIDDPQLGYDGSPGLDSLRGITFYVDSKNNAQLSVNGVLVPEDFIVRAVDKAGRDTVGISWFEDGTSD
jgi:hypothetical protein